MENIESWYLKAEKKLQDGRKQVKGQKESVMAQAVMDALLSFCEQQEEFAQAVVQGGNFPDCMTAVAKGVGGSISDLDAYKKAVQFYFPGAKIQLQMTIDLVGDAAEQPDEPTVLPFDLSKFF